MNTTHPNLQVRAVHCDYRASDDVVYQALKRTTLPLIQSWEKLSKAKRIAIKLNQDFKPEDTPYFEGMRQQHLVEVVFMGVPRARRAVPFAVAVVWIAPVVRQHAREHRKDGCFGLASCSGRHRQGVITGEGLLGEPHTSFVSTTPGFDAPAWTTASGLR